MLSPLSDRNVIGMAGLEKEVRNVVKKAAEGKKSSGGKKKSKGSGADKVKRAARELLK